MNTETTTVVCLYFPFLKDGDFELSDSEDGHKFAEIEISIKESGKSYYGCQGVKLHNSKEFWTQINFKISNGDFKVIKSNTSNADVIDYVTSNVESVTEEIEIVTIDGNGSDYHY